MRRDEATAAWMQDRRHCYDELLRLLSCLLAPDGSRAHMNVAYSRSAVPQLIPRVLFDVFYARCRVAYIIIGDAYSSPTVKTQKVSHGWHVALAIRSLPGQLQ